MAIGQLALGGGYTRLSQGLFTEAVFVDTQAPDSRFERRTGNSKFGGRTGRIGNSPPTLRQSRCNHFSFAVRAGLRQANQTSRSCRRIVLHPALVNCESLPIAENDSPLDNILQLPNIAAPMIFLQPNPGFFYQSREASSRPRWRSVQRSTPHLGSEYHR